MTAIGPAASATAEPLPATGPSTPRKSNPRGTTAKKTASTPRKTTTAAKSTGSTTTKAGSTAEKTGSAMTKAGSTAEKTGSAATKAGTARTDGTARTGPGTGTAGVVTPTPPDLVEQSVSRTPGVELRAVRARMLEHPGFAPELLALAAVETLGPRAREWAERLREAYPDADADGWPGWRPGGSSGWPAPARRCPRRPGCSHRWRSWRRCCGRRPTWCCTWRRRTGATRPTRTARWSCWC
ncbi:hypothetical protein MRQ36_11910 [Micromonospora sp. R77]|uniref:hypothetical protein n=1 Tax=Micromonospora sp. R77 TaxID=2925836 RepID=UPI001F608BF8|nr:hypothetical protein [Micromonospora sp. R77]MCI4063238.1 hypothetical protein [Micromonospora sp. R77]